MDIYVNRTIFNVMNKEILSEIRRIKEMFSYGVALNEQITAEFKPHTGTNSGFMGKLVDYFKKASNMSGKDFEVSGDEMLKYTNNDGQIIILMTNAGSKTGPYYVVNDIGDSKYKPIKAGTYDFSTGELVFK